MGPSCNNILPCSFHSYFLPLRWIFNLWTKKKSQRIESREYEGAALVQSDVLLKTIFFKYWHWLYYCSLKMALTNLPLLIKGRVILSVVLIDIFFLLIKLLQFLKKWRSIKIDNWLQKLFIFKFVKLSSYKFLYCSSVNTNLLSYKNCLLLIDR